MRGENYISNMDSLATICAMFPHLPLKEMLADNDYFQAIAPVMEPTAYRDHPNELQDQRRLIALALHLQELVLEFQAREKV